MKAYFLMLTGLLLFSNQALAEDKASPERIKEIHNRTQEVTTFDVDKTLHTFSKTVHGGVLHIVAKTPGDTEQIKLIQAYLLKLSNDFRKGDFSSTEKMHGADMPGLAELKRAEENDIKYEYEALENGAQLHFSSEYPQHVQALHEWFEAQGKDHNNDEIGGHNKHHGSVAE